MTKQNGGEVALKPQPPVRVCDYERGTHRGEVLRYEIVVPEGRVLADLCATHAKPLLAIVANVPNVMLPKPPRRRNKSTTPTPLSKLPKSLK